MRCVTVVLMLIFTAGAAGGAAPLTALERQRLVAHMDMTEQWLINEVSGLSPAQLAFRPAPNSWSILDVLEHLVVVGPIYWRDLQNARRRPPALSGRWLTPTCSGTASIVPTGRLRWERRSRRGSWKTSRAASPRIASSTRSCCNTFARPRTICAAGSSIGNNATRINGRC